MYIEPTRAQIETNSLLRDAMLAEIVATIKFSAETFNHVAIKYLLDNDVKITGAVLYSPVLSAQQINQDVPVSWPNSEKEEGVQRKWHEYTRVYEVTGGYVLQYRGDTFQPRYDENGDRKTGGAIISKPTFTQLKSWVNQFSGVSDDGFLTQSEFDAIKIIAAE